jgi:Na+/melibiose symporter-like transporter
MLILGSLLMIICHLTFAVVLPAFPSTIIAFAAIILLGISFSLVPASLWPSIPKIMDKRFLGSAYSLIFWVQNFGLSLTPMLIGWALEKSNPGVAEQIAAGVEGVAYNYTLPMLIFASLGGLALLFSLWLKGMDKRNGYGLELPNIKE